MLKRSMTKAFLFKILFLFSLFCSNGNSPNWQQPATVSFLLFLFFFFLSFLLKLTQLIKHQLLASFDDLWDEERAIVEEINRSLIFCFNLVKCSLDCLQEFNKLMRGHQELYCYFPCIYIYYIWSESFADSIMFQE